ncbi:Pesticidal crystal cry8Ba protein [Citrus sinensis]|uniref:Pesticidal crystal cry8Ba protein n=1 Tax=Citrus sinensis TaxID=2711 RepID=A0ACB8KPD6_CITSI|nr:Pesticidal crystal cry8Ba protein [Citrus sinensis]
MFTDGLDNSSLRWVREKQVPYSNSNLRPRIDPITNRRGFDLPPPSKFRSGHLPTTAIPLSRTLPRDAEESASASENEMITDSEDDVYSGRYSLDSSSQDQRIPPHGNSAQRHARYASDYGYSDVSSSRETIFGRERNVGERFVRGSERTVYTEEDEEESDSAASSEFSTTQVASVSGASGMRRRANVSEGYASSVASGANVKSTSEKDLRSRNMHMEKFTDDEDDDVPSAPPFSGSALEIKQCREQIPASRVQSATVTTHAHASSTQQDPNASKPLSGVKPSDNTGSRTAAVVDSAVPSSSHPARLPTFHASALGPWHAVIAYDACVRLCLHAWARGCMEAPVFLDNECALLRDAFGGGFRSCTSDVLRFCKSIISMANYWALSYLTVLEILQNVLLQSEEELMVKPSSEPTSEGAAPKPKKVIGKMKVQVRKVKTSVDPPTGCSMSSLKPPVIKLDSIQYHFYSVQSTLSSGWQALRKIRCVPRLAANGSFSRQSLAYVHASSQYIKQLHVYCAVVWLRAAYKAFSLNVYFLDWIGNPENFPDSLADDLIIEVHDSKGKHCGRVLAQVATISEDPCGSVAETVAYDLVLESAMKVQGFQQRNLLLFGSWKWLLTEFSSYYGVSDVYTKLRYLSYVMDVATPTADCLNLVYELLMPVVMKGHSRTTLSHQENRILGETKDQIEQILALVFENYKALDESAFSGIIDVFKPATGVTPLALEPAVKLYTLLHDILSPEAQNNLCHYFQAAAKKRSRRHLAETDEYVSNNEFNYMDTVTMATAYKKMTSICLSIKNEIFTDIEIHNQHTLPRQVFSLNVIFVDLPNLSSSIYSTELAGRLHAFLVACPPSGPSPHVAELIIATADFQKDLTSWKISPVKGGVNAKDLFHLYIMVWIQDKRHSLLESCKLDKVKWSGVRTQHSTTPFIDEVYDRLRETLNDYEVIICRWPEYVFVLEEAIADVEKAIVEALDKQYADVLSPLKENLAPKKFGLKYVQKLAKRSACAYTVPDELGILLNSMKRMLDVLRPKIESQFKSWGSCIPDRGNAVPGERLSGVTVMLRTKFRNYLQAVDEKLAENTKLQSATKLKKILQDAKETVGESDIRGRMQPLKDQLTNTINHLHTVFETRVFVAICRGYWDRMGQDVLSFLENRKENRSWYKGSQIAVSILDDAFGSQMQQLLGNALQEKDLEPPRAIMEVRSMLCKDTPNHKDNTYYY